MAKTCSYGLLAVPQPDGFKLRKLLVNLGNAYVRHTPAERRRVMRALERFFFGKANSAFERDLWSKDDAKSCYLLLKPISPKMANGLRRWASELLKTGGNNKFALKCLMDKLVVRTWIEEP